jgi:biotin synthase
MIRMTTSSWSIEKIKSLFELPFTELLFQAQTVHRAHFDNREMELCTLLSVKTGACPEDCHYCSQSGHYDTGLEREKLLSLEAVKTEAKRARINGSTRFCIGAAWRSPPKKDLPKVIEMIKAIKAEGLEACATLGMLDAGDAQALKEAGLDFYSHNLDTSPEHYKTITSTRTYQDRLDTLEEVRKAGMRICCGAIMGMGETREDRVAFIYQLAILPKAPESIPINRLVAIPGTPLENAPPIDNIEFIRMVAVTRIVFPSAMVRLSAGRSTMSLEMQALCFMAGANSMWLGDKLLTTPNGQAQDDIALMDQLGMMPASCDAVES